MRILLIIDDYLPESTRVGAKMMHELAMRFTELQHDVVVLTPGASTQGSVLAEDQIDGISIWRFRSGPTKNVSRFKRAVNETLLSLRAWQAISSRIRKGSFDLVVYYSPSIFWGPLVKMIKRICGSSSYLILRDIFPRWAVDQGLLKNRSLTTRYFEFFERISYKAADGIGLMSPSNLKLFKELYFDSPSLHVLFNWAKMAPPRIRLRSGKFRRELNLQDKVVFFYGGNIGVAQDMGNLLRLAKAMKVESLAHFLFVGQGDEVKLIKRRISEWNLHNVTYIPSISQSNFIELLSEIDIGLFSLAKNHSTHNFPGKLLGYMVESVPILGSVNPGNELLDIVNDSGAGYVFINGQDDMLLAAARMLFRSPELRIKCGAAARCLLQEKFSVESAAETIISYFYSDSDSRC